MLCAIRKKSKDSQKKNLLCLLPVCVFVKSPTRAASRKMRGNDAVEREDFGNAPTSSIMCGCGRGCFVCRLVCVCIIFKCDLLISHVSHTHANENRNFWNTRKRLAHYTRVPYFAHRIDSAEDERNVDLCVCALRFVCMLQNCNGFVSIAQVAKPIIKRTGMHRTTFSCVVVVIADAIFLSLSLSILLPLLTPTSTANLLYKKSKYTERRFHRDE